MITNKVLSRLLVAVVLSGCSSGSGRPLTPIAAPTSSASATGTLGRASVTISIPSRVKAATARTRAFVSPSTEGVSVEVTHATNGVVDYDVTTDYNVSTSASTCAGADPEVCKLVIPAPIAESPDFDSFAFKLYDQAPGGTANVFGSSAKLLGSGATTKAILADAANTITAYIDGKPTSADFVANGLPQTLVSGDGYLGFTAPIGVRAIDVDLNVISAGIYDPYVPSFAVAVTEGGAPAGSTTLAVAPPNLSAYSPAPPVCNAPTSGASSVTTCRSSDVVSASYLQTVATSIDTSYYATVGSGTSAIPSSTPVYVAPIFIVDMTDPTSSTSGPYFTQGLPSVSPALALDGDVGTVTPQEPGGVIEGGTPSFSATQNAGCNGVIAPGGITETPAGAFQIQGVALASATDSGGCLVTFTDAFGGAVVLSVSDVADPTPAPTIRRRNVRR